MASESEAVKGGRTGVVGAMSRSEAERKRCLKAESDLARVTQRYEEAAKDRGEAIAGRDAERKQREQVAVELTSARDCAAIRARLISDLEVELQAAEQETARLRAALERVERHGVYAGDIDVRAALTGTDPMYPEKVGRAWAERKGTWRLYVRQAEELDAALHKLPEQRLAEERRLREAAEQIVRLVARERDAWCIPHAQLRHAAWDAWLAAGGRLPGEGE